MRREEELKSMPDHLAYDNSTIGEANKRAWINNNVGNSSPSMGGYTSPSQDLTSISPYSLSDEALLSLVDGLKVELEKAYRSGNDWEFSRVQSSYDTAKVEAEARGILDKSR